MSGQIALAHKSESTRSKKPAEAEAIQTEAFDITGFTENFELLSDCPGGVTRLKNLVLELAVRGRLLGQKEGAWESSTTEDSLYRVPKDWSWARTGDLFEVVGGIQKTPHRAPRTHHFPYLRVENVQRGRLDLTRMERFELEQDELERWRLVSGDLLVVEGNGSANEIGRCAIWSGEIENCVHQNHIIRCRPVGAVSSAFALLFLNSPSGKSEMRRLAITTSGLFSLSVGKIRGITLPAPPLEEQTAIVAKVDQLMALCDELEARQTKKRETGTRLTKSALEALTTAETPEDFDRAWTRVSENFDLLFRKAVGVSALRDLVLELAFRGSLVGPLPGDGTARELLDTVAAGWKNKPRKETLGIVTDDERPRSPDRWEWIRLGDIAETIGGVTKGRDLKGRKLKSYPYLRVANVQRGFLDLEEMKEIEIPEDELPKYRLCPGDILFTEGGDWDKLGRSVVWQGQIDPCIHQNHVFRARVVSASLDPSWLSLFANSPAGRRYFENAAKQTTNLASINMTQLRNCPMPLPPLAEQRRIVAKVDQLLKLCDALEVKFRASEKLATRLADALVSSATTSEAA